MSEPSPPFPPAFTLRVAAGTPFGADPVLVVIETDGAGRGSCSRLLPATAAADPTIRGVVTDNARRELLLLFARDVLAAEPDAYHRLRWSEVEAEGHPNGCGLVELRVELHWHRVRITVEPVLT